MLFTGTMIVKCRMLVMGVVSGGFFTKTAIPERILRSKTTVVGAGGVLISSIHLEWPKTSDSVAFWVKIVEFSTFWCIFAKSTDSARVSAAWATIVGTGDSLRGCDS